MFIKVKATNLKIAMHNFFNREDKIKPTIDRTNDWSFNKFGKYYVGPSAKGNFLQVNDGFRVQYFDWDKANPVFHNLYRIVSKNGNDFVIHEDRG